MKTVKGCVAQALISGKVQSIGHQANCFNTMKSGVAASIRKHFPEAIEADMATVRGSRIKLGTTSIGFTPYGLVFNLYGQYNFGYDGRQYTDYAALGSALHLMRHDLTAIGVDRVGFPRLGCGLAGGEWDVVGPMISNIFNDFDVTIYVKE